MRMIALLAAALAMFGAAAQAKPLDYQVIATSPASMMANMTLVMGEKDAVLVDVPFSRADAYRVVAAILDSGRTLKAVIVTHDHPDHFFGLDVIADAFPDARLLAHPIVAKDMQRSVPIKFARWSGQLGTNAPRRPVVPSAIDGDGVMLEGHKLQVIGPMQGDHVRSTFVWDPETRTLIAGDMVYNDMFVWLGEHTPDRYSAWIATLDKLEEMRPLHVVAGHTKPGSRDDIRAIGWTRDYIRSFGEAALEAKTAAALEAAMRQRYPGAVDVYGCFLLCTSSQVATGEIKPWDE